MHGRLKWLSLAAVGVFMLGMSNPAPAGNLPDSAAGNFLLTLDRPGFAADRAMATPFSPGKGRLPDRSPAGLLPCTGQQKTFLSQVADSTAPHRLKARGIRLLGDSDRGTATSEPLQFIVYAPRPWPLAEDRHHRRPTSEHSELSADSTAGLVKPATIFGVGTVLLGLAGLGRRLQK